MPKPTSLLALAASIVLAACGTDDLQKQDARATQRPDDGIPFPAGADSPRGPAEPNEKNCPPAAGDTAQAICLATMARSMRDRPRQVFEVVRRGDTLCVHTGLAQGPGNVVAVDGEERVAVVGGRIVERIASDSIGCR